VGADAGLDVGALPDRQGLIMDGLLLDLEIDRACDEFLRMRGQGLPQPVVEIMDGAPVEDVFDDVDFWAEALGG
jgi:hypothetical protein